LTAGRVCNRSLPHLRCSYNSPDFIQYVHPFPTRRSSDLYELLDSMELETPNYSYVNVSINDEPYGLYLAIENIEEHYLEQYFGNSTGNLYKADTGASLTWTEGMTVEETGLVLKSGSESNTQLLEFIE